MTTIYQRLSPLGFAEWLEKKFPSMTYVIEWLQEQDKEPIDSYQRTSTNALAFRWLREEKGIDCEPMRLGKQYEASVYVGSSCELATSHDTYELASIACLEKAAEIIEQNK